MYKYCYVEAKVAGIVKGDDYRKIIDQYSADGWKFVTAIPKSNGAYGQIASIDLVFERCEKD